MSAAVVVGGIGAHAGAGYAIFAEGDTRGNSPLFEGSVFFVQIKFIRLRVVGDQDVGPAIGVVIKDGDAKAFRSRIAEAGFLRGIFELTAPEVMPRAHRRAF